MGLSLSWIMTSGILAGLRVKGRYGCNELMLAGTIPARDVAWEMEFKILRPFMNSYMVQYLPCLSLCKLR